MKVVFVNYSHLNGNSGIHIFNLANHLTRSWVECLACVPDRKETVHSLGEPLFDVINFEDVTRGGSGGNVDLIHVWTPRQVTRRITGKLLELHSCPYIVHLEDNEEYLLQAILGIPFQMLKGLPRGLLDLLLMPHMTHPQRYKDFLARAGGVTTIMDTLKKFCPEAAPHQVIWAGYQEDMQWGSSPGDEFRSRLGIGADEFVVAYTGNIHTVNQQEVASLYRAMALLHGRGIPARLVRTGTDYVRFPDHRMLQYRKQYSVELGYIPRKDLPSLLANADVLVQPGRRGPFNDYRFPSKLPEYLASGKPVILPNTNIGRFLRDQEQCLLLDAGDAPDIAEKLETLF